MADAALVVARTTSPRQPAEVLYAETRRRILFGRERAQFFDAFAFRRRVVFRSGEHVEFVRFSGIRAIPGRNLTAMRLCGFQFRQQFFDFFGRLVQIFRIQRRGVLLSTQADQFVRARRVLIVKDLTEKLQIHVLRTGRRAIATGPSSLNKLASIV